MLKIIGLFTPFIVLNIHQKPGRTLGLDDLLCVTSTKVSEGLSSLEPSRDWTQQTSAVESTIGEATAS
jgi:hypothetical protein